VEQVAGIQRDVKELNGSMKEPNISIYFFFHPSLGGVLFTSGRGVLDFSVLKYY